MRYFFLFTLALGLSACGYKGDLYLPKDKNTEKTALYVIQGTPPSVNNLV